MNIWIENTAQHKRAKRWLCFYFALCYLFIFTSSAFIIFLFESFLLYKLVSFKLNHSGKSLLTAELFQLKKKHILLLLLALYIFLLSSTTKIGFFIFFMVPLGYFFNKTRFVALCVLFYLFLILLEDFEGQKGTLVKRILNSVPGKIIVVWLMGLLCVLSTLHGTASFYCPSEKSLVGYKEVLAKYFCDGNFMAHEACRHDRGSIYGALFDGKTGKFYFTHAGKGSESPLCVYSPHEKLRHKMLSYAASAQRPLFTDNGNTIILPLLSEPKVLLVDAGSFKVKKSFTLSSSLLVDAVLDEKKNILYVLSENATVYKIHLPTGNIKKISFRDAAGANNFSIALNTETQTLYVTSWIGGMLTKIDADKLSFMETKRFLPSLMGVAVNEEENEIYAARPFPPAVLVLDGDTLQKKKTLLTDFGTRSVVYISSKKLLAVGNYFAGTVQFFDVKFGSEVFKFRAGALLRGITYDGFSESAFSFSGCGIYEFPLAEIYPQKIPPKKRP